MTITRRDAIKGGLSSLALISVGAVCAKDKTDVLILGAGAAGLTAAFELEKRGLSVQVVEARDRVGGRIFTLREPFSDGVYAEAGALFLLDINPAISYANQLGLELTKPDFDRSLGALHYIDGNRLVLHQDSDDRWPYDLPEGDERLSIGALRWKYVWSNIEQLEHFDQILSPDLPDSVARQLDAMTVRELLNAKGVHKDAQRLANVGYLETYNGGIDNVSVLTLARERASFAGMQGAYMIKGGNDVLCNAMAESLRSPVLLDSPVIAIEQSESEVSFVIDQDGEKARLSAAYAVVTAPLSVLSYSDLKDSFTGLRRRAIEEMPVVATTRTYFETRRPYWLDDSLGGAATDTSLGLVHLHHDTGRQGEKGVFESFVNGEHAVALANLSAEDRHQRVRALGNDLLPGLDEYAESAASVCWSNEQWSRGCFVTSLPGQLVEFHDALNEPEGRIYLAGDSIGNCPGYSHSAFRSGMGVAGKIAEHSQASGNS